METLRRAAYLTPINPRPVPRRLRRQGVDFIDDSFLWLKDGSVIPLIQGGHPLVPVFCCGFECGVAGLSLIHI